MDVGDHLITWITTAVNPGHYSESKRVSGFDKWTNSIPRIGEALRLIFHFNKVVLSGCRLYGLCELLLGSVILRIKDLSVCSDCFVTFDSWMWYRGVTTVGVVDVEAIERAKPKPERDVFHGKSNGGWEINYLDLRGFFFFFKCVGIFDILCCMWFGGRFWTFNFPAGLRSMPSILSNLISLDTNMALLALRLVAYHLPEENLCHWATWSTDLISRFVQSLLECTYP